MSVQRILCLAKEYHAVIEQTKCLQAQLRDELGKIKDNWPQNGVAHIVDEDRTVWRVGCPSGFITVEKVDTFDVMSSVPLLNQVGSDSLDF